jgi:hypothetical protein
MSVLQFEPLPTSPSGVSPRSSHLSAFNEVREYRWSDLSEMLYWSLGPLLHIMISIVECGDKLSKEQGTVLLFVPVFSRLDVEWSRALLASAPHLQHEV